MAAAFKLFFPPYFSKGELSMANTSSNVFSCLFNSLGQYLIIALHLQVSWCKFEVIVDSPKDIRISTSSKSSFEIPPVVVTAINLKTIINEKQNLNEIVSASIVCCRRVKVCLDA